MEITIRKRTYVLLCPILLCQGTTENTFYFSLVYLFMALSAVFNRTMTKSNLINSQNANRTKVLKSSVVARTRR